MRVVFFILLVSVLWPCRLASQESSAAPIELKPLLTIQGPRIRLGERWGQSVGAAVTFIGDVDRDEVSDLAIGSTTPYEKGPPGTLRIYSGADGTLIRQTHGGSTGFAGALCRMGDIDGDGVSDVFAVASGRLSALSGRHGSTLYSCRRGQSAQDIAALATLGDVDGDGHADALLGSGTSVAVVVSGTDGAILHEFRGRGVEWERFGWTVAGLGDVDGDGIPDGAAGDVDGDGSPDLATGGASILQVHSATSGRVIASRQVINPDFPGGWPGYGHRSLGGYLDGHDHPALFVVAATNFWGEGFIDVYGPAH